MAQSYLESPKSEGGHKDPKAAHLDCKAILIISKSETQYNSDLPYSIGFPKQKVGNPIEPESKTYRELQEKLHIVLGLKRHKLPKQHPFSKNRPKRGSLVSLRIDNGEELTCIVISDERSIQDSRLRLAVIVPLYPLLRQHATGSLPMVNVGKEKHYANIYEVQSFDFRSMKRLDVEPSRIDKPTTDKVAESVMELVLGNKHADR